MDDHSIIKTSACALDFKNQCSTHPDDDDAMIVQSSENAQNIRTHSRTTPMALAVAVFMGNGDSVSNVAQEASGENNVGNSTESSSSAAQLTPPLSCITWKVICFVGVVALAVLALVSAVAVLLFSAANNGAADPISPQPQTNENVASPPTNETTMSTNGNTTTEAFEVAVMPDGVVYSDFPIVLPYEEVGAPVELPFAVRGFFRAPPDTPDNAGLIKHEQNCSPHVTCQGFKVYVRADGSIGGIASQITSFYNSARSRQTHLNDNAWHSFQFVVTKQYILVYVDGVEGIPVGTSDERGVQNPKEFGRVVHSGPFIIGDDPGAANIRTFQGEVRDLFISSLEISPQPWPQTNENLASPPTDEIACSTNGNTTMAAFKIAVMPDGVVYSDFPIVLPYEQVGAPVELPFAVHGFFRAPPDTPDFAGLIKHRNCDVYVTCQGFKVFVRPDGSIGGIASQVTSFHNEARSRQTDLNDNAWHSFQFVVTKQYIVVYVDGVEGTPVGTSDERGVQNPKEFGRVVHSGPYIIGDDPGAANIRTFQGEVRDLFITSLQTS